MIGPAQSLKKKKKGNAHDIVIKEILQHHVDSPQKKKIIIITHIFDKGNKPTSCIVYLRINSHCIQSNSHVHGWLFCLFIT